MDSQKVTQVLMQIFDIYGIEIVKRQNNFKAAVLDLLPEQEYKDERIVIRNAIEADAFLPLVTASPVTADTVAMAEQRLRKTAHMADEAAGFAIRCFVAALGVNLETITWEINHVDEEDRRKQEENRGSRLKTIAMLVIFGILVWGASFLVFYLADEMDIRYMPVSSMIISICAAFWLKKRRDSNIFAAIVLSIAWGAAGFLIYFLACDGVYVTYYNDNYYDSYSEYLREQVPVEAYNDIDRMQEDIHTIVSDIEKNNGSFYYNGHQYGLSGENEQILLCAAAVITIILIHFIQKIVLKLSFTVERKCKINKKKG
ncbi:MAG: hypothetical protein K2I96_04735 [Lachnospiraceae bacterium]|nr:hypothetical protein [Lachnospiraceae bacterium]